MGGNKINEQYYTVPVTLQVEPKAMRIGSFNASKTVLSDTTVGR